MSTSSTSSAAARTSSGRRSLTGAPVIVATASATDSRCCTLHVLMTWIPASRIASTSCQRFCRAEPGTLVWASSSTSATVGRRAMIASVSISSTTTPRYSSRRRGRISSPSSRAAVWTAMGLDEPDDEVRPAVDPPVRLLEHRVRLADARAPSRDRRAAGRGRRTASARTRASISSAVGRTSNASRSSLMGHREQPVEVEVQQQDVDPRLADEAEEGALGVAGDGGLDVGLGHAACLGDPGDLVLPRPPG